MITTVFCVDFDETLSHTDRLRDDLVAAMYQLGGESLKAAYLTAYETVRAEHGVPRMPLILQTAATQAGLTADVHYQLAELFHSFPYQEYIYPGAEQLIGHLAQLGHVILYSDGDAFFQAHKIHSTSLAALVSSVIILPRKVDYFNELAGFWPAERYVFIDDKQNVLTAAKEYFGNKAMTVLVRQGRYTNEITEELADASVATIAEVAALFPV